ncbi:hypothetical protein ACOQFV_25455 [Nocardiopsis changdeensis]|uniref:LytR family transcriptional regulator n=1 Tax=Nocardiopsis changdeensis TaxID=2831969 RepID=A0ABX8BFX6_9ACTN|nr:MULTISPECIES: hypothetical protein [Nocardiopsis]QUX21140.1 hypothetical protein KGD84_22200 [Nocardiopsis changdeensis]QYX37069.1 hypothetical protein K1J57_31655 [Nocardiopsis sp. MT53]
MRSRILEGARMAYDEFGPEAEARRARRQQEMDEYVRRVREEQEREQHIRAGQGRPPGPPPAQRGGCGRGCLLAVGCLVLLLVGFLGLGMFAPYLFDILGRENITGSVTTEVCDKREDGEDLILVTGAGEFVLGDTPESTAREQFDGLEVGGVHEIVYQGAQLPGRPPPVTTGVLDAPEGATPEGDCT